MVAGVGAVGGVASGLPTTLTTTQNQTQNTVNAQTGSSTGSNMAVFSPQQQAMQGNLNNFIGNMLAGGSVSPTFGVPQAVYDAAFANFNKYQAPLLAAQHGAGSPAINSAAQDLQLQLAGMSGQKAVSNALGVYDAAARYAFNPLGSNTSENRVANGTQNLDIDGLTNQLGIDWGNLIGEIANLART